MVDIKAISGFPEFLPAEQIVFGQVCEIIRAGFERFGFSPIETPAVERKEILTAKGDFGREIYGLSRLGDEGEDTTDTDLALHFDLTMPLARYVAMHRDKLTFPFRRYQIQKVWRGERAQAGRYREFYQCDIDVVGRGELSVLNDAEIPSVIYHIFREMQIGQFVIRINNRKIVEGYLDHLEIPQASFFDVMRVVDKLDRVGRGQVADELTRKFALKDEIIKEILKIVSVKSSDMAVLNELEAMKVNETFAKGVAELRAVMDCIRLFNVPTDYLQVDLGVVRDLSYYTGTIYETTLTNYSEVGSICSGGRYDGLAGFFAEEALPGVGISIGLTRLVMRLIQAGILKVGAATVAPILVTMINQQEAARYLKVGSLLREAGVPTEVYFGSVSLSEQLRYAHRKGFRIAVIIGKAEIADNNVKLRNLKTGDEVICAEDEVVQQVQRIIA